MNGNEVGSWTDAQRKFLFSQLEKNNISKEELEAHLGFPMSDLTKIEASGLIDCLTKNGDLSETIKKIKEIHGNTQSNAENMPNEVAKEEVPKETPKEKFEVRLGSELALAKAAGLPPEMANLFFMKLNNNAYIKVSGLQYMAGKIGYQRIEISDRYDENTKTWIAEAKIYPKISIDKLEAISKLIPEVQKLAYEDLSKPTNGIGTANKENVQNTKMHPFIREMAQTRALGRALRSFTGYGSTTYEELPNSEIERD